MLTEAQLKRLRSGIQACYAIPFIDDVEDFVFEALFHHAIGLQVPNQIDGEKTKLLFDVVDAKNSRGWSCKTLKWRIVAGNEFELVIQRADVFDKAEELGFSGLTRDSDPNEIGAAVLEHWNRKIHGDSLTQKVREARTVVLLKSEDRKTFYLYEEEMKVYKAKDLKWSWVGSDKKGLRAIDKSTSFNVFRWYANQKQLFERFKLPSDLRTFTQPRQQLPAERVVELVFEELERRGHRVPT